MGPLFHVVLSNSPIYYSLDDQADQLFIGSVGKTTILSWRMLLDPSVFKQRKGYDLIDNPKLLYGFLVIVLVIVGFFIYQHLQCSQIQTQ